MNADFFWQVENEALYGALQRMQQQSVADQQEIARLTGDLSQGKSRVAEIQEMIGMLQKEKQALLRSVGDDGNDVREELRRVIEAEDPAAPLSDEDVVVEMGRRGLSLARRTVAKYRKELGIASSYRRRRYDGG